MKVIKSDRHKILMIGLDGATWDLLSPWCDQGYLPNLTYMLEQGAYGGLRSTIPPFTAPAWTSLFTGTNPGKHGVFGFSRKSIGSYREILVNAKSITTPRLWHLLNRAGYRTVVVNVPMTYPPEPLNGVMVTGMMTPNRPDVYTHPGSLGELLHAETEGYIIDVPCHLDHNKDDPGLLEHLRVALSKRERAVRYLMATQPWDFFFVVFVTLDRIHHLFWKYLDSSESMYWTDQGARFRELILDLYREIDAVLGRLQAQVDSQTATFIVSDHGFGSLCETCYINNWLSAKGYLALRTNWRYVRGLVRRFNLPRLRRLVPLRYKKRVRRVASDLIDWEKTRAYAAPTHHQGIYLNVRGREPQGIVDPGAEYEAVRDHLIEQLMKLEDPGIGKRVVDHVYRREELYTGPYLDEAPDLLPVMREYACELNDNLFSSELFVGRTDHACGNHRPNGIFLAIGPAIRHDAQSVPASIIDVAPTILYYMGIQIPGHMDGQVLSDIFVPDYLDEHPVDWGEDLMTGHARPMSEVYNETDAMLIEERLKGLGYL